MILSHLIRLFFIICAVMLCPWLAAQEEAASIPPKTPAAPIDAGPINDAPPVPDIIQNEHTQNDVAQDNQKKDQIHKQEPKPLLFPRPAFYLDAAQYLALRADKPQTHLLLTYEVTPRQYKTGLATEPRIETLRIGPDFVAVTRNQHTRIFDFKLNRHIFIVETEDGPVFSHRSLFSTAFSHVKTVKMASHNGTKSHIQLGTDHKLDIFWLESGLGWTARNMPQNKLNIEQDEDHILAHYGDVSPFKMTLGRAKLPSPAHARALFSYWHHDMAIHPNILLEIGLIKSVPQHITLTSFTPKLPEGQTTHWALKEARLEIDADFPLSPTHQAELTVQKNNPVYFVMMETAHGRALKDRPSLDEGRQKMYDSYQEGYLFKSWLIGQSLAQRQGGCVNDPGLLCEDIATIEEAAETGSDLAKLIEAQNKVTSPQPETRQAGLVALYPFIKDGDAPSFLVKQAGYALARLKSPTFTTADLNELKADKLMEEALAKNPYDPEIYQYLAQIYAAQQRYHESWDVQDALRNLPDVPEALIAPINRVENSLFTMAPGYFVRRAEKSQPETEKR